MKKFVLPQLASSIAQLCAKPHLYRSVNNPSHGKTCALAMQQFFPRVVVFFLLALVSAGAWAADYVFMSGNNYIIINNGGAITTTTTFNPSTCLWSGTSGGAFTNNGKTLKYSQTTNSEMLYTYYSSPEFNTTTGTNVSATISTDGSISFTAPYRRGNITGTTTNETYYIQFSGSALSSSTSSNANNLKAYQVTTSSAQTPTFSISYPTAEHNASVGSVNGKMAISANVSGNYCPKYYSFNGHYYLEDGTDYGTSAPAPAYNYIYTYELVGECTNYATISGNTVTYTKDAGHDVVAQVKVTAKPEGYNVIVGEETCSFTLRSATIAAPVITKIEGTNQYQITTTVQGASIKYTTDGADIDEWGSNGTTYSGPITITTPNTVIKAKAVREGNVSTQTEYTINSVTLAPPTITISDAGSVTITNPNGSVGTIHYTINGNDPDANSSTYSNNFTVNNMTIVKAIVTGGDGYVASEVASKQYKIESGVSDGVVTLNDYEDHNWAYYKGRAGVKVGTADDAPDYNVKYKYTLYSPDPRNVKITYRGYDTAGKTILLKDKTETSFTSTATSNVNVTPKVSNSEPENTFVYYKTLEKFVIGYFTDSKDWNGLPDDTTKERYPYTVISNPFSVRPSTGSGDSKKYYGFAGWKIISGGKYIGRGNGDTYTAASDGDVLDLDELIHFLNLDKDINNNDYTPNCTSAEVVLEATWTQATRWSGNTAHAFSGGTYETNFIVASGNIGSIEQGSPCTIIGMNPDGTGDNSGTRTITGLKVTTTSTTDPYDRSNCVKVEWIRHGNGTFDANGRNMTMGRGIISSSGSGNTAQGNVYGNNTNGQNVVNTVKVESGYYSGIANINDKTATSTNAINSYVIMGCDYDRALANYYVPANEINNNAYNIKLRASRIYGPNGSPDLQRANGQLYMRSLFKSGVFATEIGHEYYFHTYQRPGQRYIEMEGGYNKGHVKGGSDGGTSQGRVRAMSIRMKGGRIDGQLACGSTSTFCSGDRLVVITGGRIGGWLAPGSNCSGEGSATGTTGTTDGTSYVYFGGTAEINSRQFGTTPSMIFQSTGGVIYGAGLGYRTTDRTGEMTLGSNIVFADEAYTERGIYGGGAIGQALTSANIFILGGRVGTGTGQIKDQGTNTTYNAVKAGVYGGACDRGGENSFIYMDGGTVESGIYGGANINGTMSGNAILKINGGQVGVDATHTANVHGGGYGQPTRVTGNVDVTIGKENATEGATIYGDVYGGSALGHVNGETVSTTKHTNVTLNAGTINGSLYGGALGQKNGVNGATSDIAANVYGPVQVTVNGGSVKGENSAVYGCNNVNGAPQSTVKVDIYKTDAHNAGSDVDDPADDIYAINAVYGGGNQANYTYTATDQVYPQVTVHNCDNSIKYVYGGGNQATVPGTKVDIYGGNIIGNVFGGGNNANVTTNGTDVNIYGGTILNVYGGNNNGGAITGTINVDVAETKETTSSTLCPVNITDLYGGGNKAASAAGNITIGKCSNISNVYGGANQANVTGPIILDIVDGNIGTVFGGNNNSGTITGAITVNVKWNGSAKDNESDTNTRRSLGSVYGGGNKAPYTGNPTVNFTKGITTGSVFGGGLGKDAVVTGNPTVNIGDWATKDDVIIGGDVFGGGDLAAVEGNPSVTVRECGTIIEGDLYGGGNAAPVYSTNTTMWGGTVMGNVFGGGNGADGTKNAKGAQVGYKSDDSTAGTGEGNAVLNVYGGTIGTWTTDSSTGVSTCQDGTGGVFGGSNTNGNIRGEVRLKLDQQTETGTQNPNNETCSLKLNEVYGSGNEAAYAGTGINFTLGCVDALEKIYGGAKNADMNGNIHLKITSGTFKQVFGGNNIGGKINGTIKVTVDETGCHPVIIDELYGGGNQAPYSIYGYETALDANTNKPIPLTTLPSGGTAKDSPVVNVVSCTHIGQVFGGGLGSTAVMVGNPTVNIQQIPGKYDPDDTDGTDGWTTNPGTKLGTIGDIFGGGNAAKVVGDTYVNIGTETAILRADGTTSIDKKGANISGNVYGGGNQADVTGKTHVQVGAEPATTTP